MTVHRLLRYSTRKEAESQEELFFRKKGSQGRDTTSTSTQDDCSRKVLTKRTQQLIGKKVIFTWQRDTVLPTGLSTLQSGRPQVQPPLHT